jgi:hypothetical protein
MPDDFRGAPFAVAGIPFVHEGDPGVPLPEWITPNWPGSRITEAPIRVYHSVGDTASDGLDPLVRTTLPHGEYYFDDQRNLAILARGAGWPVDRPQLLRTRRSGFEYTISYQSADDALRLQWGWHRTIFMFALPLRARGLSVHATGFVLPGQRGILCPGVSGAGKSTLARLLLDASADGVTVLGDDRIAVTAEGEELRLWGTPWHSSAGTAVSADAPCRALLFMRPGKGAQLDPIDPGDALRRVLRTVAIPFWDRPGTEFALQTVDRMVTGLPCFEFAYEPGPDAADYLVKALSITLTIVN